MMALMYMFGSILKANSPLLFQPRKPGPVDFLKCLIKLPSLWTEFIMSNWLITRYNSLPVWAETSKQICVRFLLYWLFTFPAALFI